MRLKKLLSIALILSMVLAFSACSKKNGDDEPTKKPTEALTGTPEASNAMTYQQFISAALDTEVTIEAYVQAKQSWWDNKATVYAMDRDGGYYLYEMACSEADYALLVPGTKIRVNGYKSEWSGEVEITDAAFEILTGDTYIAEPVDVTELLDKENLSDYMNRFVSFTGMTVAASTYTDDEGAEHEAAWLYKMNNTGTEGDDLYFKVSYNGKTYTFTVESYLCGKDTEVYKAVRGLQIGDVIDMEGFLYWYNGVNPHITSVKVK